MRKFLPALILSSTFAATSPFAAEGHTHGPGGHSHAVSMVKVTEMAVAQMKSLVERGKIDKSWADVAPAKTQKQAFDAGTEWVVTFRNEKVADPAKQTLYVFYTMEGKYLASNFTGK